MSDAAIAALVDELHGAWARFAERPERPDDVAWVAARLALMFETDQRYRDLYVVFVDGGNEAARQKFAPIVRAADAAHRDWLAAWLVGRAWPSRSVFGAAACEHAWMIALHADGHPFQREALAALEPLLGRAEVDPVHYAALFDRVALGDGRPQRFGMFYTVVDGREQSYPVEAPDELPARRARLGLAPDARFRR